MCCRCSHSVRYIDRRAKPSVDQQMPLCSVQRRVARNHAMSGRLIEIPRYRFTAVCCGIVRNSFFIRAKMHELCVMYGSRPMHRRETTCFRVTFGWDTNTGLSRLSGQSRMVAMSGGSRLNQFCKCAIVGLRTTFYIVMCNINMTTFDKGS